MEMLNIDQALLDQFEARLAEDVEASMTSDASVVAINAAKFSVVAINAAKFSEIA
jgi:hypothetical protein